MRKSQKRNASNLVHCNNANVQNQASDNDCTARPLQQAPAKAGSSFLDHTKQTDAQVTTIGPTGPVDETDDSKERRHAHVQQEAAAVDISGTGEGSLSAWALQRVHSTNLELEGRAEMRKALAVAPLVLTGITGSSQNEPERQGEGAHRTSVVASGTTSTSGCAGSRVQAQKELERSVEVQAPRPTTLLNHWRSRSTRDTMAMGSRKMEQTKLVMSSKRGSAGVSRMLQLSKHACLLSSL